MMTQNDFLTMIKARGAILSSPIPSSQITLTNGALQRMRAAMLPTFMFKLYEATGGINLGTGYILGPTDTAYNNGYPVPNIVRINEELLSIPQMHGKTLFGRNDLFWFAFDSFGTCYMLDTMNLHTLRKYDDPYQSMIDCLFGGKI